MTLPIYISVQTEDFDVNSEMRRLSATNRSIGAMVSFVGLVRDINENNNIQCMTLEHYPGMTEKSLTRIAQQAAERWPLQGISIIHRVGTLNPCDQIVLVLTASKHRHAAFSSADFLMDYLKSEAPFWKKEDTPQGAHWVDARDSDQQALARWQVSA